REASVNRRPDAAAERDAPVSRRRPAATDREAPVNRRPAAAEREGPVSMGRQRGGRVKADGEGVRPPAYGAPAAPPAAERRERGQRHHEDDGPPVIGLGDHVPSFLLRPVALRPAKVGEE
ncbi:MAG: DEAD/DEAH box helicase, partial [Methylocystis silviterrae]